MAAITWQNINGPSVAQAASPLGDAQKTFGGMFSGFEDILTKRAAMENANWDQTKLNNTNAFLNATQEAKTPEEFAAREGMLREQLKGYGAQVDPMAARAALDGRMTTLQQRAKAEWEFQNAQTDQKEAPIRDEALAAIARRDFLTANIIKSGNPGMRNMAAIEQAQATAARNQTVEGNQDTKFAWEGLDQKQKEVMRPFEARKAQSELDTAVAQRSALGAQADASRSASALANANLADRRSAADALKTESAFKARLKGTMYEGGVYTGKNAQEISTLIDSTTGNRLDEADKNAMKAFIAKMESEGGIKTANGVLPIPLDILKSQILGAKDEGWGWSTGGVNYLERTLKAAMEQTVPGEVDAAGKPTMRSPALDGYNTLLLAQKAAIENPTIAATKGGTGSPKSSGEYKPPKLPKPR